jgi:diadenosine tetraphosphate (Ap4A) HIT family hydrolase
LVRATLWRVDAHRQSGAAVLPVCSQVAKALIQMPGIDGVNLLQNSRPASGQVVFHTHFRSSMGLFLLSS